jgi:hypothetical protein
MIGLEISADHRIAQGRGKARGSEFVPEREYPGRRSRLQAAFWLESHLTDASDHFRLSSLKVRDLQLDLGQTETS